MKSRYAILSTIIFCAIIPMVSLAQAPSYNDVMLVVNDASKQSVEIGGYFASRRNIPASHICHINADTSETMDSAVYVALQWKIEAFMRSKKLIDSISYIVTTKGCPLRIATKQWDVFNAAGTAIIVGGSQSSFEDCLALINGVDSTVILQVKYPSSGGGIFYQSPYYLAGKPFKHDSNSMPIYLVTRLDGYTVADVKALIVRSETPSVLGDGLWVLDVDPGRDNAGYKVGNDWLRASATNLQGEGMNVFLDTTDTYIHGQKNVIGYGSWGSNDGHSGGGLASIPGNTWLNGAIGIPYVSTSGRSFAPGAGYGQSLIADWIAEGITGIKGFTDEPYLFSMAHPDVLFNMYTSGFNLAESFYAASQFIGWRQVIVGDPKVKLAHLMAADSTALLLGRGFRFEPLRDSVWVHNIYKDPVTIDAPLFTGRDSLDFSASLSGGGSFPHPIAAGDSARIVVSLLPTAFRTETAQIVVLHKRATDSRDLAFAISLSGVGLRPALSVPDTVKFGQLGPGQPVTRMVRLVNMTKKDTITISKLGLSGATAAKFKLDTAGFLPRRLVGGESVDVPVIYTETVEGEDAAILSVTSPNSGKTVQSVQLRGTGTISGLPFETGDISQSTQILSVTPNPFASNTEIRYRTSVSDARVKAEVFDALGRLVSTTAEKRDASGEHVLDFTASNLPSGTYLCRITVTSGGQVETVARNLILRR